MSKILDNLEKVHFSVHYLKPKYSISFYTGGGKISNWSNLTTEQKNTKLNKDWYLRWSYRDPSSGKMKRQQNIKAGINFFDNKRDRLRALKVLERNLINLLENGYSPYSDSKISENINMSVSDAFKKAMYLKEQLMAENSFIRYQSNINSFKSWLLENGFQDRFMSSVEKKHVVNYLNEVLERTSERTRNNHRADIATLFQIMEDNDIIDRNFVASIPRLKSKPKRNKAFTVSEVQDILSHLKSIDSYKYLFFAHIYYGLFRPITASRIKIKDIDLENRVIDSDTKTGDYLKQIPKVLFIELTDNLNLSNYDKDMYLFTMGDAPGYWNAKDDSRREWYGKYFKKHIKDNPDFDLDEDHTVTSLRHAAIGKLFVEKVKDLQERKVPNFVEKALDFVRGITLHKNNQTVRTYLREIGYFKIEDWSDLL